MAQEWYYTQGDRKVGPVSAKVLRQAAADGTLQPTTLVWTEGMKEWKEARMVKGLEGLWPSSPLSTPARRTAKPVAVRPPSDADDHKEKESRPAPTKGRESLKSSALPEVAQQWWLIGLSLFCCFPAGLILIWLHPQLNKTTKWVITGVVGVIFIALMANSARQGGGPGEANTGGVSGSKGGDDSEWVEVAVSGAEKDRKKFTAAESWGTSKRVDVMKRIVKKFKQTPDRLASNKQTQQHNSEMGQLIEEFKAIPFNGSYQSLDAKRMIDMWEKEIEGQYSGFHYRVMDGEMINIVQQYKSRVH
jgi:hypothetical protein